MSYILGKGKSMIKSKKSSYIFAVEVAELDWPTFFYCNRPMPVGRTLVQSNRRGATTHTAVYIPSRRALGQHDFPTETLI